MPINGGCRTTPENAGYMTETFDALLERACEGAGPVFLNIGCHREGAGRWKKPLIDFCHGRRCELRSANVVFTTVTKAARIAARGPEDGREQRGEETKR